MVAQTRDEYNEFLSIYVNIYHIWYISTLLLEFMLNNFHINIHSLCFDVDKPFVNRWQRDSWRSCKWGRRADEWQNGERAYLPPNATKRSEKTGGHASKKQVEECQDLTSLKNYGQRAKR